MGKRLFDSARAVGDVGVGVELAEVEPVAVQGHRGLIGEGTHFADLLLGSLTGRQDSEGLNDQRLAAGGGRDPPLAQSQRAGILEALLGGFAAVGGVVDGCPISGSELDGVARFHGCAAGRGGADFQAGYVGFVFGGLDYNEGDGGLLIVAGGPVIVRIVPEQIVIPVCVLHIVLALSLGRLQNPSFVFTCTGVSTGMLIPHTQRLPAIGERP